MWASLKKPSMSRTRAVAGETLFFLALTNGRSVASPTRALVSTSNSVERGASHRTMVHISEGQHKENVDPFELFSCWPSDGHCYILYAI